MPASPSYRFEVSSPLFFSRIIHLLSPTLFSPLCTPRLYLSSIAPHDGCSQGPSGVRSRYTERLFSTFHITQPLIPFSSESCMHLVPRLPHHLISMSPNTKTLRIHLHGVPTGGAGSAANGRHTREEVTAPSKPSLTQLILKHLHLVASTAISDPPHTFVSPCLYSCLCIYLPHSIFNQAELRQALHPYLFLTQVT
jgi:hypothetical protein